MRFRDDHATSEVWTPLHCRMTPGRPNPPMPAIPQSRQMGYEVLDAVNKSDGDGFWVHGCPGADPPMSQ
jgi:hypothetical protein